MSTDNSAFVMPGPTEEPKLNQKAAQNALELFHRAAKEVPAYADFLKKHNIKASIVKTIEDYRQVPYTDKENYVSCYSLAERSWGGKLEGARVIASSTGSTGAPFFWPRGDDLETEASRWIELILRNAFEADKKRTLLINSFALGNWSAGVFMLTASLEASRRGLKTSLVNPGINKSDIIKSIKQLAPEFEQIVLIGYPPFVKDIVDMGEAEGVDWSTHKVKLFFGGEGISEAWRDYILKRVGSDNPLLDTANVYGTAEAGLPGVETPLAIALRRLSDNDEALRRKLFNTDRLVFVYQYHPAYKYFEAEQGELLFTADNITPFLRYNLHDHGGIMSYGEATNAVGGKDALRQELKRHHAQHLDYHLPFVYLTGRPHNNASLYGVNIYPENIKAALEDVRLRDLLNGKFRMGTEHRSDMDQYLHIKLELAPGIEPIPAVQDESLMVIKGKLIQHNSEYKRLAEEIGTKADPILEFLPHGSPDFAPGIKHNWSKKP